MKKVFLFLVASLVCQYVCSEDRQAGPVHPLMPEYYPYINAARIVDADSIYYNETTYNGIFPNSGYKKYTRSADGLKDTILTSIGLMSCRVDEYFPDGKLISRKELIPERAQDYSTLWAEEQTTYNEYDSDGRIISTIVYDMDKNLIVSWTYEYTGNSVIPATVISTEINRPTTVKKFSIRHTATGYVFEQITESTDYVHNTVRRDTTEREYVFDPENRLIRAGDAVYTYPEEGGYVETLSYRTGYYNRQGYPEKFYTYYGGELVQMTEITYFSNESQQNPNPPQPTDAVSGEKVYAARNGVVVQSANPVSVTVYSIDGKLVKKTFVDGNNGLIKLPGGFYIVKTEKASYKVFVGR